MPGIPTSSFGYNYFCSDALGSLVAQLTLGGSVVDRLAYQPYGESLPLSSSFVSTSFVDWEYRLAGYLFDGPTGLYQVRWRYLHSKLGCWVGRDPIGYLAGDLNSGRYVKNRVIRAIDPSGLVINEKEIKGGGQGGQPRLEYSCNCGWIDWGHANPKSGVPIWNDLKAKKGKRSLQGGGWKLAANISSLWGILSVQSQYFISDPVTDAELESIFLGVWRDLNNKWEDNQVSYESFAHSSWSEEDLASDDIQFYRIIRGYSKDDIRKFCKSLSKEKSLKVFKEMTKNTKNKNWNKWISHPESPTVQQCCGNSYKWPKELSDVTPAASGKLFRDWTVDSTTQLPNQPVREAAVDEMEIKYGGGGF